MLKDKLNYKILVVEDNEGDFVLIEDYLQEQIENPKILRASSFIEFKKIIDDKIDLNVIILDLSLPDKSGEKLLLELKSLEINCPVIVLTGYTDFNFSIKSISLGIADYLLKDEISASALYKSVIYCIERKKSNDELAQSNERYSQLFHMSIQPMWVYNPNTLKFIQVNKAALELYGYTENEFLNLKVTELWTKEERKNTEELIVEINRNAVPYNAIQKHTKKSGEIFDVEMFGSSVILDNVSLRTIIAADVTEKIKLELEITKAIVKTQEDERYEIGSELHDNVCQILATSQLSLGMLQSSLSTETRKWYNQTRKHILHASGEIRNLSHRLAPSFFEDSTMEDTLGNLITSFNVDKKWDIKLFVDPEIKDKLLNRDIFLNIFRIVQEQLRNIFKYAKATVIEIDLIIHEEKLKLRINDNGIGFEINNIKKGIGLANIKRRAELFGGTSKIISSPKNGCEVLVAIPI
ncbi:MAG: PAS domain S-box protein [Ferruginibacter sp.]